MDLVTHAAIGAAAAVALAPARDARPAAIAGALAGLLPDADVLIASRSDPLLNLEFHRHFTHALVFVPVGAAIAAALLRVLLQARLGWRQLYLSAFLAYLLAVLVDACTSYGTHLLWPFRGTTQAWSVIAVFDPAFSLLVLVPLAFALVKRRPALARGGLGLACAYLALGFVQHQRALSLARDVAASRGHAGERLLVKPTMGNLVLWRSLDVHAGRVHVDGLWVGLPGRTRVYDGDDAPLVDSTTWPAGSKAQRDVARFVAASNGLVVRHPGRPEFLGDARYAMLPTRLEPLWGVVVAPDGASVRFETARELTPETRAAFLRMLLGR